MYVLTINMVVIIKSIYVHIFRQDKNNKIDPWMNDQQI